MSTAWHDVAARSLLSDLPPGRDRALLHLLTCATCREWATLRLLEEQRAGEAPSEYDEVFRRIRARLPWILEEAERRRIEKEILIAGLLGEPAGERLKFALAQPSLQPIDLLD